MSKSFLLPVLLVSFTLAMGQNSDSEKPTLDQQFQTVRAQAEVIESYRMLKAYQVESFWKVVLDTLREKDQALADVQNRLVALEKEMSGFQKVIDEKDQAVAEMEHAGTHITVLGSDWTKAAFLRLVGFTFLVLLVLAGVAFFFFKVSFQGMREARHLYDDVSQEFESYKHKMVEKEVKLLRELQDHRNKLTDLMSA